MGIISLHIQMLKTTSNILVFSSNYKKCLTKTPGQCQEIYMQLFLSWNRFIVNLNFRNEKKN